MKPTCIVSCPIDTHSGYGARSRDLVNALIKVKDKEWDIKIMPQRWGDTPWNFLPKNDPLRSRFIQGVNNAERPNIWIQLTVPNEFQPIGLDFNIGISAGIETTVYPHDFLEGMNKMDLNLVSSEHSKNVALNTTFQAIDKNTQQPTGVLKCEKPCDILFEGLDLNRYFKNPTKSGLLEDISEEFCFLYTGGWLPGNFGEDRKNVASLIRCFLETFNTPSNKKPALILKTYSVDNSILDKENVLGQINRIRKLYSNENAPNIYLLHGELTDEEMNMLNNDPKVKAFVSFTKGEGFGRPILEGAITGKPTIVSNWSGHIDFLHKDYNCLVGGELKKVHESAANQFLLKDSQWFNINPQVASKAMKDVYKNYKNYWEKSRKQTQYIKDNWSFDQMCEKLDFYLKKVNSTQTVGLNMPELQKIDLNKL